MSLGKVRDHPGQILDCDRANAGCRQHEDRREHPPGAPFRGPCCFDLGGCNPALKLKLRYVLPKRIVVGSDGPEKQILRRFSHSLARVVRIALIFHAITQVWRSATAARGGASFTSGALRAALFIAPDAEWWSRLPSSRALA